MDYYIAIRHAISGLEKTFPSLQHIADFLASVEDRLEWHGHEALGELPAPTAEVEAPAVEPAATAAERVEDAAIHAELQSDFKDVVDASEPNTGL